MLRFSVTHPRMCGRFSQTATPEIIAHQFEIDAPPLFKPRYNIAPSQNIAAIRIEPDTTTRKLVLLRWGLIPSWATDRPMRQDDVYRMIRRRADDAGHEVTSLVRSGESAAAMSTLGAKVRRGDLSDLDGLKAAAAESDGVIHPGIVINKLDFHNRYYKNICYGVNEYTVFNCDSCVGSDRPL
jgi:SOS response associated peptidase (SRAP)